MNRALFIAAIVLSFGAIGWGLSVVGGPSYARMQENDIQRVRDLNGLGLHYRCVAIIAESEAHTPDGISPNRCGYVPNNAAKVTDPLTQEDYVFTQIDPTRFQVCATFEIGEEALDARTSFGRDIVFDGTEGCVTYKAQNSNWVVTG